MSRTVFGIALVIFLAAHVYADEPTAAVRIRFGMKDKQPTDWSGTLSPSKGKVESIRGWRWAGTDGAEGNDFSVATRRPQAQSAAERKRVQSGQQLPISDNGIVAIFSGTKADTTVKFDSAAGKVDFKLADVPYGQPLVELDGNMQIERVPASTALAESNSDEDYPAVATAKDGTLVVAYLSFTHGKDFQGSRERPATPDSPAISGPQAAGAMRRIEKPEDYDYLAQPTGGEQIFLRTRSKEGAWSEPIAVTDGKLELYRPAVAIDGSGKIWVFYSAHLDADKNLDYGNWELMARSFDTTGKTGGATVNISSAAGSDFMPAATTDSSGRAYVTWVGARGANFNVFVAGQDGEKFAAPKRVSEASGNEWEPAIAAGTDGSVAVAWDTYAKGDYDVYIATRGKDGTFGKPQAVAASLAFEVRPSLAYDGEGKLWIAYEESGDQWGKDFGALKKLGIPLYQTGRALAMRVMGTDGKWFAPPDVMDAMPRDVGGRKGGKGGGGARMPAGVRGSIAPCFPRIATGSDGNVWLAFRGKPGGNWRVPVGSVWFEYVTRLTGSEWAEAVWVPRSSNVLDSRPALVASNGAVSMLYSGDGRGEANPAKLGDPHLSGATGGGDAVGSAADPNVTDDDAASTATPAKPAADAQAPAEKPKELLEDSKAQPRRGQRRSQRAAGLANINCDLFVTTISATDFPGDAKPGKIALATTQPAQPATPSPLTGAERDAIQAMHDYKLDLNGEKLQIWRGEFHRHTEYSPDGGGDGGLLDLWRYAIDAADLDWIGDGDHDYGSGREYTWWTTQKAVTLFTLPDHFTPMYCYERSVSYPEGHRNCMFAQRGIRSLPRLPISDRDVFKPAPDTQMLYGYLKRFNGICAPHTSATGMGTDWRNYDAEVEPFVEIYQGDRNSYERPDAPRSAVTEAKLKGSTPEKESLGGWEPKGFVNLALKMGRRYAFESSSDHISTHLSYCNVFVTEPTRENILESIKKKRVYGATDNIIADVRCTTPDGKVRFMGEEFTTSKAPTLNVHIVGAQRIAKVTIIKDDEEVHVATPDTKDVTLSWTDPHPTPGKVSYYYVRGEQVVDLEGATSGELVWASPMWITYEPGK